MSLGSRLSLLTPWHLAMVNHGHADGEKATVVTHGWIHGRSNGIDQQCIRSTFGTVWDVWVCDPNCSKLQGSSVRVTSRRLQESVVYIPPGLGDPSSSLRAPHNRGNTSFAQRAFCPSGPTSRPPPLTAPPPALG